MEISEWEGSGENAISPSTRVLSSDGLFVYRVLQGELAYGSSLGNAKAWATSKGTGAIESLYSLDLGREVLGSLTVSYFIPYNDLSHFGCPRSPLMSERPCDRMVMLSQVGKGVFSLHPAYQRRDFSTIGSVDISECFFLPHTDLDDQAVVFSIHAITNRSDKPARITVVACLDLVGSTDLDVHSEYDGDMGGLIACNQSNPMWMRGFRASPKPDRYMATSDIEEAYDPGEDLSNMTDETGRIVGSLQVNLNLEPGESREVAFTLAFSPDGREGLRKVMERYTDHHHWMGATVEHYAEVLRTSEVLTPDTIVNQGGQWSKANMIRVLGRYPCYGTAFTNDPGNSSNVVARDVCWYVYGADYVVPLACCNLLHSLVSLQQENGKIVEYYNAITGDTADYGLNINDNTPLFILAAAHHLNATGHQRCMENLYPSILRAAECILSQRDERGLVFCTATGTGARGIAGWRNIIEDKNISGAVTEINSECYAALVALADIAHNLGRPEDQERFHREAASLREAVNRHLLNPKNGTYYLNIDPAGNIHTEVTADEIFPLMFGVADEETGRLISTRLSSPDFLTSAGLRTVPAQNPLYIPDKRVGLEGGVWPGVTWWYAIASSSTDPALMVNALRSSYRHYIEYPDIHNTVPGQFSEWFDGESLVNRGMRLSPWEPPRFLWALIEGALGLNVGLSSMSVNPRIPPDWHWLILRRLPYHGGHVGFFMAREMEGIRFYTSSDFDSKYPIERYDQDISAAVRSLSADMHSVAMARDGEVMICLASAASEKQTAAFSAEGIFDPSREYIVNVYSSETGDWTRVGPYGGDYLSRLSAWIEPGGFSLLRVAAVD